MLRFSDPIRQTLCSEATYFLSRSSGTSTTKKLPGKTWTQFALRTGPSEHESSGVVQSWRPGFVFYAPRAGAALRTGTGAWPFGAVRRSSGFGELSYL